MGTEPLEFSPPSSQLRVKLEDGFLEVVLCGRSEIPLPHKRLETTQFINNLALRQRAPVERLVGRRRRDVNRGGKYQQWQWLRLRQRVQLPAPAQSQRRAAH